MNEFLSELIDKWTDVLNTSEDWTERNIAQEVLDDLKDLLRNG